MACALCLLCVQVGDRVTKGQVVCIVEAMKLMNEIEVRSWIPWAIFPLRS